MSVSVSPIERMRSFTRYAPELVEPPARRGRVRRLVVGGDDHLAQEPSTYEPGGGMPEQLREHGAAIASLSVDAAGSAPRVPGCAPPAGQALDVVAAVPE